MYRTHKNLASGSVWKAVLAAFAIASAPAASATAPEAPAAAETTVTWENLGNEDGYYVQRLTVTGNMDFDKLAFNMFARGMQPLDSADSLYQLVPGYYAISSPRFRNGAGEVVVDIRTNGYFRCHSYAPDGFHAIMPDNSTRPVNFVYKPVTEPHQWQAPGVADAMPYGDAVYEFNETLAGGDAGIYDVIPSYKSVSLTGGVSRKPLQQIITIRESMDAGNPDAYTITINDNKVKVTAANEHAAKRALASFNRQVVDVCGETLPNAVITDWPDFPYRGVMLDVSRNFQPLDEIKKIVDYMQQYRMNVLHFHLVDDEGWRLEIPELPELTAYGAFRGYSPDEADHLFQIYAGDGNPNTLGGPANGYYTEEEFVAFLRYAYDRGVSVIPEIDTPGHSRAAVRAMEKRYRDTGDASYRLIHDGDSSTYTSAQAYHDNVMNPALPGPYKFLDTVTSAVQRMYNEAGVPLLAIHIGGDEVARGAWNGSEPARRMMEEKGLETQTAFHGMFVESVAQMLAAKGIPMSGWQEIAVGHTPEYNAAMAPLTYSVNCWTQSSNDPERSVTRRAIDAGFPVVLSNVNHFYLDQCYNRHPEEPGLIWGGTVDEFASLHGYPAALYPQGDAPGKVIGISGQLFAETMRSPQTLELYLFPKMLGLAERAWNADTTYTDARFNAVVVREIDRWVADGTTFHLRQPGIIEVDGMLLMNSPYAEAEIRYTTDGSEPTRDSALYTAPVPAGPAKARAKLFYRNTESLTTHQR